MNRSPTSGLANKVQEVGLLLIGLIVSSQYPLSRKLLGLIVAFMFSDWLA
jgi:hypothetical protein